MSWQLNCRGVFFGAAAVPLIGTQAIAAGASSSDAQPIFASIKRAIEALAAIGQPISAADASALEALSRKEGSDAIEAADGILSKYTIVNVALRPDGYARTTAGGAPRRLIEAGWAAFLVRVANPSGSAAKLNVTQTYYSIVGSADRLLYPSTNAYRAGLYNNVNLGPSMPASIAEIWWRAELYQLPPIGPSLSGAAIDYQVIQIFSRDRGKREMHLDFWTSSDPMADFHSHYAGRGAQLSFDCTPSSDVLLHIRDTDGRSCMASLIFKDKLNRVYPYGPMRLEPDMYFQPQIYRADGETVRLPDGEYSIEARRGPEYLVRKQSVSLKGNGGEVQVQLERWIDPAKWGWYSGDTHIHAGGCAHYEYPTEGVSPATVIRHVRGEGLSVGDILSWGPSWFFQKQFFTGHAISPPAGLENPALQLADNATWTPRPTAEDAESMLRYDVEVSGFPSSGHCGHLVLLRLKEQDYPGTSLPTDWPSWNLPILKWAKSQGAVVGYPHCGIGMQVDSTELPNYEIPPMDGPGTQEAIVDITHGVVDFLAGTNTFPAAELNGWYHLLNCGFRLPLLGETDWPCLSGERPGMGRTYVKLDERPIGDAGYENWVRNLTVGRLYCGDGRTHFLDWNIAGQRSGEKTIALARPAAVEVKCLVAARLEEIPGSNKLPQAPNNHDMTPEYGWNIEKARVGQSREVAVELIVNGRSVEQHRLVANGQPQELSFSAKIERSSWMALRVLPSAHTDPIIIEVEGKPIRASKRSAQWCRQCVDKLWNFQWDQIREAERPAAVEAYDHARHTYDRIIAESADD